MKFKFLTAILLSGTMLAVTSCASEDSPAIASGDTETFTVSMPAELATRAFDSGLKAKNLYVAVYPKGSTEAAIISNFANGANASSITSPGKTSVGFDGQTLTTTISIPLVKQKEYEVVFWAESYTDGAADDPYVYDSASRSITVKYANMPIDSEEADAFYAMVPITANGQEHPVTLKRPFAQINVGTNDLTEADLAGKTVTKAGLTFSSLATNFNLATSKASVPQENVSFATKAIPTEAFPKAGYDYLAMAYVLVGDETSDKAEIDNIALTLNDDTQVFSNYPNVPAERNYRTNIYGSLLTNPEVFNVEIAPAFETEEYDYPVVSTEKELTDAINNGNPVSLGKDLAVSNLPVDKKDVKINLNGRTLTVNGNLNKVENNLELSNGNLVSNDKTSAYPLFSELGKKGSIKMDHVNLTLPCDFVLIHPDDDSFAGNIDISDCKITSSTPGACGITTNAANAANLKNGLSTVINIKNTEFVSPSGNPLWINIPITVNATNCTFTGANMIVRGGNANLTGCTINCSLTDQDIKSNPFLAPDKWITGNGVTPAYLTVGNTDAVNAYSNYPTNVTLTNCVFAQNTEYGNNPIIVVAAPTVAPFTTSGKVTLTIQGCTFPAGSTHYQVISGQPTINE